MPRSRIIKHDFWTSEDILELEMIERLFYIGFWNFADDSGILPDKPKKIKCMIFPADNVDCKPIIDNLVDASLLVRYTVDCESYLKVINWNKHQTIRYPTYKYPLEDGSIPDSSQRKRTKKKDIDIDIGVEEVYDVHVPNMYDTCDEPVQHTHTQESISEHLQQITFSSLGGPYIANVTAWLQDHEEKWIIEAIARAEAVGKCRTPYVNAILEGFKKEGYPKKGLKTKEVKEELKVEHTDLSRFD